MRKLLVVLLCGTGTLIAACSSANEPQPVVAATNTTMSCDEAKAIVKSNHEKIGQAFANRDATAIGTLELQNRDIVHANLGCFPKLKKQIQYWKKMDKEMSM